MEKAYLKFIVLSFNKRNIVNKTASQSTALLVLENKQ